MNEEYIMVGRVCVSRAGRDKGKYLVIVGHADEKHVFLADGALRMIERPKRKKLMHVTVLADSLNQEERASNAAIKKALAAKGYAGCKG